MKTPKRELGMSLFDLFAEPEKAEVKFARYKRKNRVKQLKRSLHRYKNGTMLGGQYDLYLAYRWLQRLQKPNEAADSARWENYYYKLGAIRGVLVAAQKEVEEALQKALERENRKEQA